MQVDLTGNRIVNFCDLTKTDDSGSYESSRSCIVNYGSAADFEDFLSGEAHSSPAEARDQALLYSYSLVTYDNFDYVGWENHVVIATVFKSSDTFWQPGDRWALMPVTYNKTKLHLSNGSETISPLDSPIVPASEETSIGMALDLFPQKVSVSITAYDILQAFLPFENPAEKYWGSIMLPGGGGGGLPPLMPISEGLERFPMVTPTDEFETIPEQVVTTNSVIASLGGPARFATGGWTVKHFIDTQPFDNFEVYSDDAIISDLNSGDGWESGWNAETFTRVSDDFESYPAGSFLPYSSDGGEGWEDGWVTDFSLSIETFESYTDGDVLDGSTTSDENTIFAGPWIAES
jgi:hypothetical protein